MSESFPKFRCKNCQSTEVISHGFKGQYDYIYEHYECLNCGKKWTEKA